MRIAALLAALAGIAAIAQAAGPTDVTTLNRTRTIVLEDVPTCDLAAPATGRALQVGADAVKLRVDFDLGTAHLSPSATTRLDDLVTTLRDPALADARFLVAGHTDARGGDTINLPLSCQRAQAVRDYLVAHGIDAGRLQAQGFGARMPLAGSAPLDAANRRVEVRRLAGSTP